MSIRNFLISVAAAAPLVLPVAAHAQAGQYPGNQNQAVQGSSSKQLSQSDRAWLEHMAEGSKAEVQMGKLAQKKSDMSSVQQLGQRLEQDHQKFLDDAKPVADQLGVQLKEQPTQKMQMSMQELEKLSPKQFNARFVKMQVEDHKNDIKMTEQATSSQNPQVRALAQKTLPILQEHEKMAKDAQAQIK